MPDHQYPAVGRCIYCGTTTIPTGMSRFGDEHIIPLALGGSLILREASCLNCAGIINSQIETPILAHEWGPLRDRLKFPRRKKHRRKPRTHLAVTTVTGGTLDVPIQDHSTPVMMYRFREPRIFSGAVRSPKVDRAHWSFAIIGSHQQELEMQRKYTQWNNAHVINVQPNPFARLLAKIAYGYAYAEYGIAGFSPLGRDIILGHSDDCFYTVGGTWEIQPAIPGGDHITKIEVQFVSPERAYLIVDIRLFSQIETPAYIVAVGEIDIMNPEHVRVFGEHRAKGRIVEAPPFKM